MIKVQLKFYFNLFLSENQANVYNVELSLKPEKTGSLMDCLFVTLLSTKRHFEDLEEYRAPSITNT